MIRNAVMLDNRQLKQKKFNWIILLIFMQKKELKRNNNYN